MTRRVRVAFMRDQPYEVRSMWQLNRWVEGRSIHNDIDDECVPDFSCCRQPYGVPTLSPRLRAMFRDDPNSRHAIQQSVIDELMETDPRFLAETEIPGVNVAYYTFKRGTRQ